MKKASLGGFFLCEIWIAFLSDIEKESFNRVFLIGKNDRLHASDMHGILSFIMCVCVWNNIFYVLVGNMVFSACLVGHKQYLLMFPLWRNRTISIYFPLLYISILEYYRFIPYVIVMLGNRAKF